MNRILSAALLTTVLFPTAAGAGEPHAVRAGDLEVSLSIAPESAAGRREPTPGHAD